MAPLPTLTAIGSCRVYDPLALLQRNGELRLNQQNIFGFVHNSREVLQQLALISGTAPLPGRLRPFLNIPDPWKWVPHSRETGLDQRFARTDCFVVEVSSVRLLRFKAMFLQLNRTRELLAPNPGSAPFDWWAKLTQQGRNDPAMRPRGDLPEVHREVIEQIACEEQERDDLVRDIAEIARLLPRPVLFVSHFNTTTTRAPIRQRQLIVDALEGAEREHGIAWWDPTHLMLAEGPANAMLDSTHYQPAFVPAVGEGLFGEVRRLLARAGRAAARRPVEPVG